MIFVLGLVLGAIVKNSSTATRKDVEGYPTWEEIVNQVKIMMIMMIMMMVIMMIMVCYPTCWEEIVNQVKIMMIMMIMMMVILMIMVCYPTWEEIVNQVKAIEENHSELVSVQTIGR